MQEDLDAVSWDTGKEGGVFLMADPQAQILAKSLLFIALVGLAFVLGQGSFTGSTVGDFGPANKEVGIAILALGAFAGVILYVRHARAARVQVH